MAAKRKTWRNDLQTIAETRNTKKIWDLVKRMEGKTQQVDSKALHSRGRLCTTPKAKANAFLQEYAEVSGRRSDRRSRRTAVEVNLRLKAPGISQEIEEPFTAEELKAAINNIKIGKAAGPDELTSDYIRKLPQSAREDLLKVYNYSWGSEWIPQSWQEATIIPVLKKGKDPAAVGPYLSTFRPISLTSHLGKTMERLVLARMNWCLEQINAVWVQNGTLHCRQLSEAPTESE